MVPQIRLLHWIESCENVMKWQAILRINWTVWTIVTWLLYFLIVPCYFLQCAVYRPFSVAYLCQLSQLIYFCDQRNVPNLCIWTVSVIDSAVFKYCCFILSTRGCTTNIVGPDRTYSQCIQRHCKKTYLGLHNIWPNYRYSMFSGMPPRSHDTVYHKIAKDFHLPSEIYYFFANTA